MVGKKSFDLAVLARGGVGLEVMAACRATDIAGQGLANPVAMILSGAMMLDWLGRRQRRFAEHV